MKYVKQNKLISKLLILAVLGSSLIASAGKRTDTGNEGQAPLKNRQKTETVTTTTTTAETTESKEERQKRQKGEVKFNLLCEVLQTYPEAFESCTQEQLRTMIICTGNYVGNCKGEGHPLRRCWKKKRNMEAQARFQEAIQEAVKREDVDCWKHDGENDDDNDYNNDSEDENCNNLRLAKRINCRGISSISFAHVKLPCLECLLLEDKTLFTQNVTQVSNIDGLQGAKIPYLKCLMLYNDCISDISVLERVKFPCLNYLGLSNNNVRDISVLERVKFPCLETLNLEANKIRVINVLERVKFPCLKVLQLNENQIRDISVFQRVYFPFLKELILDDNQISDIGVLERVEFHYLQVLQLKGNQISDIGVLERVKFPYLKKLDLTKNQISDIRGLFNAIMKGHFPKLKEISLYYNPLSEESKSLLARLVIERGIDHRVFNFF